MFKNVLKNAKIEYLCAKNLSIFCVLKMKLIIKKSINLFLTINAYLFKNKQRLCKKHIKKKQQNILKNKTFKNIGNCY